MLTYTGLKCIDCKMLGIFPYTQEKWVGRSLQDTMVGGVLGGALSGTVKKGIGRCDRGRSKKLLLDEEEDQQQKRADCAVPVASRV
jgi:hypothetical protein